MHFRTMINIEIQREMEGVPRGIFEMAVAQMIQSAMAPYVIDEETPGCGYGQCMYYIIGDSWPCMFLVKKDCPTAIYGKASRQAQKEATPEGYRWVAGACKKDIEWDMMLNMALGKAKTEHRNYTEWMKAGKTPTSSEYTINSGTIEKYGMKVFHQGESFEEFMWRKELFPGCRHYVHCLATLFNGDWSTRQISFDDPEEKAGLKAWVKRVDAFIGSLDENAVIVGLHCDI